MKSLQGHLLIASPDLLDANFLQAVVLMVRHTDEGALGLILNRPTSTTLKHALTQVSDTPCARGDVLRLGGPCQGSLMALHTQPLLMEIEVLPHIYFSAQASHLEELVATTDGCARFFVGFSGWGPGQLESELDAGSWRTMEATFEQIFQGDEQLWKNVTKQLLSTSLLTALKVKHVPKDPSHN
jgi:putative transcriptional regulator